MNPRRNTLRREMCTLLCNVWCNVLCALAILLSPIPLEGQASTGQIQVEVKDPSGAPMEASGKLESLAPGVARGFQTDSQGKVTLDSLPYGRYRLEISKAGFTTQSALIDVQSGTPISRTVTMALGNLASQVDVVATTPLRGIDLPLNEIPSAVQTATDADIKNSAALDLGDFMNRRLNGVYVNEMQDNPFQPDVNYRGYTASPLLGTPEGLSVYVDGVRQNQPFGDVVSWDLIQRNAISEMALIPGSDPVFGLNTLGGSISVTTKDGVSYSGLERTSLVRQQRTEVGRRRVGRRQSYRIQLVLRRQRVSTNPAGASTRPRTSGRGLASLAGARAKTDLALTMTFAYNTLTGNGIQDYRLLQDQLFERLLHPRQSQTIALRLSISCARHSFSDNLTFSGNAWYRWIRTEEINGNANNDAFAGPVYHLNSADQAVLTAAGYTGFTSQRPKCVQHPVSLFGLHRECAAARRPRRDLRRR